MRIAWPAEKAADWETADARNDRHVDLKCGDDGNFYFEKETSAQFKTGSEEEIREPKTIIHASASVAEVPECVPVHCGPKDAAHPFDVLKPEVRDAMLGMYKWDGLVTTLEDGGVVRSQHWQNRKTTEKTTIKCTMPGSSVKTLKCGTDGTWKVSRLVDPNTFQDGDLTEMAESLVVQCGQPLVVHKPIGKPEGGSSGSPNYHAKDEIDKNCVAVESKSTHGSVYSPQRDTDVKSFDDLELAIQGQNQCPVGAEAHNALRGQLWYFAQDDTTQEYCDKLEHSIPELVQQLNGVPVGAWKPERCGRITSVQRLPKTEGDRTTFEPMCLAVEDDAAPAGVGNSAVSMQGRKLELQKCHEGTNAETGTTGDAGTSFTPVFYVDCELKALVFRDPKTNKLDFITGRTSETDSDARSLHVYDYFNPLHEAGITLGCK